jgi:anhydro-N-acetylmuramic acid kinase
MTASGGRSRLLLGLMSGTSADGVDVALVRVGARSTVPGVGARLLNFTTVPFPANLRAAILRVADGGATSTAELSQLNFRLGLQFARAALRACSLFGISPRRVHLIGSHGQTVYHQGTPSRFLGARVASTLQIGEPAVIAAHTGITTVGDFRPADMSVGGQGAPLVPFVDYLLYRDARRGRAALNIGGIANVTVIPRDARPGDVFAFDTGPGNMVIDALVRHFSQDRRAYDRNARMARSGRLLPELLASLLSDSYLRRPPPKTAGREQYGAAFLRRIIDWGRLRRARPADLVHTATILTTLSITDALRRWVLPKASLAQLIVAGGGSHNPLIMAQLASALPEIELLPSDALGVPADAKEAFAFALLADQTMHRRPANLPSATGAVRPAILGKICYAPPR